MAFETYIDAAVSAGLLEVHEGVETLDQHPLLNGAPYKAFRQSIDLDERRRAGTFFSGPEIADKLAAAIRLKVSSDAVVMDPTCGLGDLLLAYASGLPIRRTLVETLDFWGCRLAGMDTRSDLVRMTKVRLLFLARARGRFSEATNDLDGLFPLIAVGDALKDTDRLAAADAFLFNPPFGQVQSETEQPWAKGQINAAAIFLATLIAHRKPAAPIAAILPEVLRCGSRYGRFRDFVSDAGLTGPFEPMGRFDAWTDVDVFWTLLQPGVKTALWRNMQAPCADTVGDRFIVRVGTVVPHRHDEVGVTRPFLCAKTTPAWAERFEAVGRRRFDGTVFKPPFVVIRRTSSPSDRSRAVGSIIVGNQDVAVENHLIVARPKSGTLADCRALLRVLKSSATTDHLNHAIRCRHLTTVSVASLPWRASNV
ncbi:MULTISPECIES: N-6 DNA methylase [Brevundimonas]|uniref:DNA methylase adenine-specific domain-containing protein n=1 Tax=Brevundimonas bullata TaxID=13160 RepID=A0A7W7N3Z1_9CAUL|nr:MULTISPECIES: N-6 DNA methylase [Brevundimonas]MBB4799070.1 hypothetical protein [Brevundimonas bullata]MBB6384235.1 hypothetical protein [Brevundimonas bullata]